MDSSSINTLTGTTDKRPKGQTATGAGNSDAFATAMGEAGGDAAETKRADLVHRDVAKDKEDVAKNKKSQAAEPKAGDKKVDGRVSDYVKSVSQRDPATLSMVEKQAFRLGEFSNSTSQKQGLNGLAQMFAQQGINMSGFSPEQIKSLMSRMDTKELGKVMAQMQSDPSKFDEKTLKDLKEKLAVANQQVAQEAPQQFDLQAMLATGTSKEAGEAARAEQRREIMDQILNKIDIRTIANQTELNLRLNPEYLGEVKISLTHDDDGVVRAKFQTTSKATREVLTDNTVEFLEQARDKGVRISKMDVELVDEIEA